MSEFFAAKVAAAIFGLLFFSGHLARAVVGVRAASCRDHRLEAVGVVIPGLAGLLFCASALASWPLPRIILVVACLPTLVFGRAVYELIVFRKAGDP